MGIYLGVLSFLKDFQHHPVENEIPSLKIKEGLQKLCLPTSRGVLRSAHFYTRSRIFFPTWDITQGKREYCSSLLSRCVAMQERSPLGLCRIAESPVLSSLQNSQGAMPRFTYSTENIYHPHNRFLYIHMHRERFYFYLSTSILNSFPCTDT